MLEVLSKLFSSIKGYTIENENFFYVEDEIFIDILYQSQHLLHRFFQFEPTTKTPPLSEILEPLI